ncbi:MAG: hypothetical protein SVJ22_05240 [Halobacteriota archaeon]|nr:hypothetical protein [Halobacteriota archaeon]
MRRTLLILFFITLIVSSIPVMNAETQSTDNVPQPAIIVTGYEVYPEVLMKGDRGTIGITIKNTAKNPIQVSAMDPTVYMMSADIKSVELISRDLKILNDNYYNVGELGAGESLLFTFEIEADVPDGIYFPRIYVDLASTEDISYQVPVRVDSTPITLALLDIPKSIPQNERSEVKIGVSNTRPNSVGGVSVIPKGDNILITPSKYFIGEIEVNEMDSASFNITPHSDEIKNIHFDVIYRNGDNWDSETLIVPINIGEGKEAEILLTGVSVDRSVGLNSYVITGELDNIGTDVAGSILIKTEYTSGVEPIQPYKSYFVGTLEVDDFGSFELHMRLSGDVTEVPVIIQYRDSDGDLKTLREEIPIEFNEVVEEELSEWWIVFIICIIAIVAVIIGYSWKVAK